MTGCFDVQTARFGQHKGLAGTVEKFDTHFFFNLSQRIAQRGLGDEELPGSLGDAAAVRDGDDVP